MTLPTRRAFRPDSQYYRTTRRQRLGQLAEGPGVARGAGWGPGVLLGIVAVGCGAARLFGHGGWVTAAACGAAGASLIAWVWVGKR